MINHGSLSVIDFLVSIKQIVDELTTLVDLPSDADLLVYATCGLGHAYKELIIALRTQDFVVLFEELFDKVIDHETFLLHNEKHHPDLVPPTAHLAKNSSFSYCLSKPYFPSPTPSLLPNPTITNQQHKPNTSNYLSILQQAWT